MSKRIIKRRKSNKKKGGGCGCQNTGHRMMGGNNQSIIPLNTYGDDATDPSNVVSVRIQPNMVGGSRKSKKNRKSRRRTRRNIKRGGGDALFDTYNANIVSSFNTVSGSPVSADILAANPNSVLNNTNMNWHRMFI